MNVEHHPRFTLWLDQQADDLDIYGDLCALLGALESQSEQLLSGHDECHPVVTSPFLFALRRTPPTVTTPYATRPPVIRMLFALTIGADEKTRAAIMLVGGDKTHLGNLWYPPHIAEAHSRLSEWNLRGQTKPIQQRGTRR